VSQLIVDAPLLACPDPNNWSPVDFQQIFSDYLSRLCELERLRTTCKSIQCWRDEELSLVLHDQGCFPFRHSLKEAFQQLYDPLEYQIEDVINLVTALLDRSTRLEESGDIKDILVSGCSVDGDPAPNRSVIFLQHLARVMALALPVLGDGKVFHPNTYLASCGVSNSSKHVTINCTVDMAEKSDGSCLSNFTPTSAQIENYRGAVSLFRNSDLTAWWANGSDRAIRDACAIHLSGETNEQWESIDQTLEALEVGDGFISSADALGFMHDPQKIDRLMRVCGDLVSDRNLAKSHWLRKGRGGNEAQRVQGEWRAWRHDIDYEFHLHYWRKGTRIRLANVVVHNDFGITD
jgi:hypothetical protein